MPNKFLLNLSFLIALNILVKPFWVFIIDLGIQNTVGPDEYGIYFTLFSHAFLLHILLDFGISNYNNRSIAQSPHLLPHYLPNLLILKTLLIIAYTLLSFLGAFWIGYSNHHLYLLVFLMFNQITLSFILYFRSNLQGLHLFKQDRIMSILDRSLMIIFCSVLLWGGIRQDPFTIDLFIYAQSIAYILSALIAWYWLQQQVNHSLQFTWDPHLLKSILKKTYPFALIGLLMSIYARIDSVMLHYLLPETGNSEAGIYAASYRLLDAVHMFAMLFSAILLPLFARMLANKENINDLVHFNGKLLFAASTIIALSSWAFSADIMSLLYLEATPYYAQIFGYLIFSFIGISSVYVYGTLLTANNNLWTINSIALLGVLANIALNYILIDQHKALGATIATLITQNMVAAAFVLASFRILALQFSWIGLLRLLVFTILCSSIAYYSPSLPYTWFFNWIICLVGCLLAALLLRIIDLTELKKYAHIP
jgi:O-antigen/teichoic acid export membrane protein